MKMFKALIKTRLLALWHTMFVRSSQKKLSSGKKALFGLLAVYIIIQISMSMAMLFGSLAEGLFPIGLEVLYFCVASVLGFSLCFVGSIFMTQSLIFEARDTELLVSMPIPTRYIVASRFLPLFVLNYIYTCMMLIPAIVIRFMHLGFDGRILLFFVICSLCLPFLCATVTCIFGWLSAIVSSGSKSKIFIQTIAALALFGGYMIVNFNIQNYITKLVENGESALSAIEKAAPPFYWFGAAISNGDITALIKFALCCIVPFILVYLLISKTFFRISLSHKTSAKKKYVQGTMKASGARAALIRKEFARFFSMPNYMLNCGIGALLALMLAGTVFIKGEDFLLKMFPMESGELYVPAIYCVAICFCTIMCNSASVSLSIEGKSFGILKSMPVSALDVYTAKVITNMAISMPCGMIAVFAGWYAFDIPVFYKLAILAVVFATSVFGALFGITVNTHFPKFDWLNATVVIKQSTSSFISVFGGMGVVTLPTAVYGTVLNRFLSAEIYLFIVAGILLLISCGMFVSLRINGEKLYREMG